MTGISPRPLRECVDSELARRILASVPFVPLHLVLLAAMQCLSGVGACFGAEFTAALLLDVDNRDYRARLKEARSRK
jgi:hypothetical protein